MARGMGGETIMTSTGRSTFLEWYATLSFGGAFACVLPSDFHLCTPVLGAPASLGFLIRPWPGRGEPHHNPLPSRFQWAEQPLL